MPARAIVLTALITTCVSSLVTVGVGGSRSAAAGLLWNARAGDYQTAPPLTQSAGSQYELPAPPPEHGQWYSPVMMERGVRYPNLARGGYVITNAQDWAALWDRFHGPANAEPVPDVPFDRTIVIAVYSGQQPSGGFTTRIRRIVDAGAALRVEVDESLPGRGCMTTSELTNPGEIVYTARPDKPIEFQVARAMVDC